MQIAFTVLSAVFAALTSILAKVGIDGVNLNLATAIKTVGDCYGMGNGVFDTCPERCIGDESQKLVTFDFVKACNRGILILLFQDLTDGRCVKDRFD